MPFSCQLKLLSRYMYMYHSKSYTVGSVRVCSAWVVYWYRVLCYLLYRLLICSVLQAVEVSWESPVWMEFLGYLDQLVLEGLKKMLLQSLATVSARAQRYEQVCFNEICTCTCACFYRLIPILAVYECTVHDCNIEFTMNFS